MEPKCSLKLNNKQFQEVFLRYLVVVILPMNAVFPHTIHRLEVPIVVGLSSLVAIGIMRKDVAFDHR